MCIVQFAVETYQAHRRLTSSFNKSKLSNVIGVAAFVVDGVDVGAPPLMEELILMSNMYDAYMILSQKYDAYDDQKYDSQKSVKNTIPKIPQKYENNLPIKFIYTN